MGVFFDDDFAAAMLLQQALHSLNYFELKTLYIDFDNQRVIGVSVMHGWPPLQSIVIKKIVELHAMDEDFLFAC
ncbi:MAG: hypothetical protein ACKO3F_01780, partial [Cyanobium sp.]